MPDRYVRYEETTGFRAWLAMKGYDWARMTLPERKVAVAEEQRECLEKAEGRSTTSEGK